MDPQIRRKFGAHADAIDALLRAHELQVPSDTLESLYKTRRRYLQPDVTGKDTKRSWRSELRSLLSNAERLRKYLTSSNPRRERLQARMDETHRLLNHSWMSLNFALTVPRLHVPTLLDRLESGRITADEVSSLIEAIRSDLEREQGRWLGRPRTDFADVVAIGCRAWVRSGRPVNWSYTDGKVSGSLPIFLRELIACCGVKAKNDDALACSIKQARAAGFFTFNGP